MMVKGIQDGTRTFEQRVGFLQGEECATSVASTGNGAVSFYIRPPGAYPMYYSVHKKAVWYDESKLNLKKRTKGAAPIHQVRVGEITDVYPDGRVVTTPHVIRNNPIQYETSLRDAGSRLLTLMSSALRHHTKQSAAVLLSGGVDSLTVAKALMDAGKEVVGYTVYTDESEFDFIHSQRHAQQLGIDHVLIKSPDPGEFFGYMKRALLYSGVSDYHNAMMATATLMAQHAIKVDGFDTVFHGHMADSFLGNRGTIYGAYRKRYEGYIDPETWQQYRFDTQVMCGLPQSYQISAVARHDGMDWCAPFGFWDVWQHLLSLPLDITPPNKGKKLLRTYMAQFIDDPSWGKDNKGEVGYPSSVSAMRDQCDFLTPESIRRLSSAVKERFLAA